MTIVALDLLSGKPLLLPGNVGLRSYDLSGLFNVPPHGTLYLQHAGMATSKKPIVLPITGSLVRVAVSVDQVDSSRSYDLEVFVNDILGASLSLPAGTLDTVNAALSVDLSTGDEVKVRFVRTTGSGQSSFRYISASLDIQEA